MPAAAIPPDAQKVLDEKGLKISSGNLALAGEGELAKMHAEVPKLKKTLIAAERELHAVEEELEQINTQISSLKVQHMELSAGLTRAAGTTENNRYVGALEATRGQIELAIEQQKAASKRLSEAMSKANDARESYIEHVLAMRAKADGISSQWKALAADTDLATAVEQINATGRTLKLAPSPGFVAAEKRLAALEQTVLSEAIPMTVEGNTLMVNVTIDGKHRCQMQVDSGANSVTLSYRMAKEMGLEPKPTDPKVIGVLADGSEVEGTRIRIGSMRVGKFTAENVDATVFSPKAVDAAALLGMSFLGNFTVQIDKAKAELRLAQVDSGDSPGSKSKAGAGKVGKSKVGTGKSKAGNSAKSKKKTDDDG